MGSYCLMIIGVSDRSEKKRVGIIYILVIAAQHCEGNQCN